MLFYNEWYTEFIENIKFSWTENKHCNEIAYRQLLTCIWVQIYFLFWNRTRISAELSLISLSNYTQYKKT